MGWWMRQIWDNNEDAELQIDAGGDSGECLVVGGCLWMDE
jgi:hypothetical protein